MWVLVATGLFAVVAVLVGGDVASKLSLGGTEDPASETVETQETLTAEFEGAAQPDFVLLVTAANGTVDDEAVHDAALALQRRLDREPGVAQTQSYWSLDNAPPLRSIDGRTGLMLAALARRARRTHRPRRRAHAALHNRPGADPGRGHREVADRGADQQAGREGPATLRALHRAAHFIALVFVFGSLVAAFLPLVVGVLAILGTFVVLTCSPVDHVSVFALNLTTALGLGLAIDYSLFIVSRYREEMASGEPARRGRAHDADRRPHGRVQRRAR